MASDLSIALHKLHGLLAQLEDAERSVSHGPRRIATAEKQVQAARDAVEQQKLEIKARRKAADECNLRLRTREAELLKLQGMLNQASSNKEYDIVRTQIATATNEKSQLEDLALSAMDLSDTSQQQLKSLEASLKQLETQSDRIRTEIKAAEPDLQKEVSALQAQVAAAEQLIPWGDKSALYLRLRAAHGRSALAAVEELCCSACNNRITTQDFVRINTGNLICCRECGRIVYAVGVVTPST